MNFNFTSTYLKSHVFKNSYSFKNSGCILFPKTPHDVLQLMSWYTIWNPQSPTETAAPKVDWLWTRCKFLNDNILRLKSGEADEKTYEPACNGSCEESSSETDTLNCVEVAAKLFWIIISMNS